MECNVQGHTLAVALGNRSLTHCGHSLRIDGNGEGSTVGAVVCSCSRRGYESVGNGVGKSLVVVPRTRLRQYSSVAGTDNRLTAYNNSSTVDRGTALTVGVEECLHLVVGTRRRTHAYNLVVAVGHTLVHIAGKTVVERSSTCEGYLYLSETAVADIPSGIGNIGHGDRIYSNFVSTGATGNKTCIAVAFVAGFVAYAIHFGEG